MQKKKILHLITGLDVGGTETMLLRILPELQSDFDNRVCCIVGRGPIGEKLKNQGISVYYLDYNNILDMRIIIKFKKIIQEFQPDTLITYLIHADLFGRIFGRIFGIKNIISSQRGSLLQWEFLRFFDKITKFLVTKYIVQTEIAKKELLQTLNIKDSKVIVIPNAINSDEFDSHVDKNNKIKELGIRENNANIICVSNLRREKGHGYLLTAFDQAFSKNKKINLLIVGDGEEKEKLIAQTAHYASKNNIYFLGKRNDIKELLKISDIFILPTLTEGMSNAILEAMVSKIPIITTSIPVNIELLGSKGALFVEPRNIHKITDAIFVLLNNKAFRETLIREAKNRIDEKFDINKIKKILVKTLSN